MYNALDVARYIMAYEKEQGRPISNLRLQKLLYFVQAQFVVFKGIPCFSTRMEAWDFGPVVPVVYREYRIYGGATIPVSFRSADINTITDEDKSLIDLMLDHCGTISTTELVSISHKQDPWKAAYHNPLSNEITAAAIRNYFGS